MGFWDHVTSCIIPFVYLLSETNNYNKLIKKKERETKREEEKSHRETKEEEKKRKREENIWQAARVKCISSMFISDS